MVHNDFGLDFHHFGLAVKEIGPALLYLEGLGYQCDAPIYDPLQKVNLVMCRHGAMPAVEVIFPGDASGPLDGILAKRPDGVIYHLCYESADLTASLVKMRAAGLKLFEVSPPKPAVLFKNRPVSFYMVGGLGLIEIIG